jgi:hypothetical protein
MYKLLIPLSFILFSNLLFAQQSKMDIFEKQMLNEYQYYNLKPMLDIVMNGEVDKKFEIGDNKYKVKIRRTSKKAETDEIIHYIIKRKGTHFIFSTDSDKYYLQSQNLSFSFRYSPMAQEISFISKPITQAGVFKLYGYTYRYIKGELFKLEDFVIRDAYGRANSID